MFRAIDVVGRGRLGGALAARLAADGRLADGRDADLVVICVPDREIAAVAAARPVGPWIAHMSGATPLAALDPHPRRFGLHPLQTFIRERGPEQFDGAWAAVTGDTDDARDRARWLAGVLGLRPFDLAEASRTLYHAGAAMASNFLVTLHGAASQVFDRAGAPPEALIPLMTRTIENGFQLTGPMARGDVDTVRAHLTAIERDAPDFLDLYRVLAARTTP